MVIMVMISIINRHHLVSHDIVNRGVGRLLSILLFLIIKTPISLPREIPARFVFRTSEEVSKSAPVIASTPSHLCLLPE